MKTMRTITAYMLVPAMKLTGFRFSKDYRWGISRWNRFVYATVDTVGANWAAGMQIALVKLDTNGSREA